MSPIGDQKAAAQSDKVRQTIIETLEAPRLKGITTRDFVVFKEKREIYERRVQEKIAEQGHSIPLTSYRNSIDKNILGLFVTAQWVSATKVQEITDEQLKKCVEERATIKPEDYDLAQIEEGISKLRMDKSIKSVEQQVWKLGLAYATTLDSLGYEKFIDTRPKLASGHLLQRITHEQLRKRMKLTLKLRKEDFKDNYNLFMRETAKEAQILDRLDAANALQEVDTDSDIEVSRPRKGDRNGLKTPSHASKKRKDPPSGRDKDKVRDEKPGAKRRKRLPPWCLNKKCGKRHYMDQCDMTTAEEKERLLAELKAKKARQKKDGDIHSLSNADVKASSSLFSATLCDGAIESTVLTDQGSDANVLPPHMITAFEKANARLALTELETVRQYGTVDKGAKPIACSRKTVANILLRIRHGTNLSLRGIEWMVSDNPIQYPIIGRHVLRAIGLDNRVLLAAASDRFNGVVDVPRMLREQHLSDEFSAGTVCSLLEEQAYEYGSTYHSTGGNEADKLEESNVYIDLGDDPEDKLDAALDARVEEARQEGMSENGVSQLRALLAKHKQVFE